METFAQLHSLRMGTGDTGTPTKAKVAIAQQASYPEWAAAFQAYYNSGSQAPHGYFPTSVAPGAPPPPYMWGLQPILPPYGTLAHRHGAMYSHRGVYGHPAMTPGYGQLGLLSPAEGSTATLPDGEADGCKSTESAKSRSFIQRSKRSLINLGPQGSKGSDTGNGNRNGNANDVFSQSSGESGSDGSSKGSEEDNIQNKHGLEQITKDGGGPNCTLGTNLPHGAGDFAPARGNVAGGQTSTINGTSKISSTSSVTTYLGIGVQDNWSGSARGQGGKRMSASASSLIVSTTQSSALTGALSREGVPPEMWFQDEREVKRQRRKQSNRESARRSRLRKQAECEELGTRVDALTIENMALRTELTRLAEECQKLTAENASLLGQLQKSHENDAEVFLDQGIGEKCDTQTDPAEGHETMLDMSSESPQTRDGRAHDEDSCYSWDGSSPLESGSCPETELQIEIQR